MLEEEETRSRMAAIIDHFGRAARLCGLPQGYRSLTGRRGLPEGIAASVPGVEEAREGLIIECMW